jgi:hypothetical protein
VKIIFTTRILRSLSRLRGRVGVGVSPRVTLFAWREFPHTYRILRMRQPKLRFGMFQETAAQRRPMLPRKRER